MNQFDLERANRDATLFNTDGRLFDLVETNERLELRSRSNAFPFSIFFVVVSIGIAFIGANTILASTSLTVKAVFVVISFILNLAVSLLVVKVLGFYEPKRWIFDKSTGFLWADRKKLTPLSFISHVRCFKMRRRFKAVLKLTNGREFHLGSWRFGMQEWAWRQDAAQIAEFLNVPLEIPPAL